MTQRLPHSDLHSYLLGDHEDDDNPLNNNPPGRHNNNRIPGLGHGLHAAHQAILQQGGPVGFRSYHQPVNFPLKVTHSYSNHIYPVMVEACVATFSSGNNIFFVPLYVLIVQIILLVVFMCVTLLLASLICLTLPGKFGYKKPFPALSSSLPHSGCSFSPPPPSVCRSLADVFLDGQRRGS